MPIEALKDEIRRLSNQDRQELLSWLTEELEDEAWDRQIEQDFAPGGRGVRLAAQIHSEIAAGHTRPLAGMLAELASGKPPQTGQPQE